MPFPSRSRPSTGAQSPQKTLIRFATLLGTFKMKEAEEEGRKRSRKAVHPGNEALSQLLSLDGNDDTVDAVASFPSLALHSESGKNHDGSSSSEDKHQLEQVAASNLSRPIIVIPSREARAGAENSSRTGSTGDSWDNDVRPMPISKKGAKVQVYPEADRYSTDEEALAELTEVSQVPHVMLENLSASFSLLLDARLRAYATFLSSHGLSLAKCPSMSEEERKEATLGLEHKLSTLLDIGTHTSIDSIVTSFHVQLVGESTGETCNDEEKISMPLVMEAVMDVSIPNMSGGKDCLTISVRVPGTIDGSFEKESDHSRLKSVRVDIDAHELLEALMARAGLIMSVAVERVNATVMFMTVQSVASSAHEPGVTAKETSHDDMPPPQPRHPTLKRKVLSVPLPIVSPDIGALKADSLLLALPPPLQLNEDCASDLSLEKCANIVDSIIGQMDTECFGPPTKRLHTSAA